VRAGSRRAGAHSAVTIPFVHWESHRALAGGLHRTSVPCPDRARAVLLTIRYSRSHARSSWSSWVPRSRRRL